MGPGCWAVVCSALMHGSWPSRVLLDAHHPPTSANCSRARHRHCPRAQRHQLAHLHAAGLRGPRPGDLHRQRRHHQRHARGRAAGEAELGPVSGAARPLVPQQAELGARGARRQRHARRRAREQRVAGHRRDPLQRRRRRARLQLFRARQPAGRAGAAGPVWRARGVRAQRVLPGANRAVPHHGAAHLRGRAVGCAALACWLSVCCACVLPT